MKRPTISIIVLVVLFLALSLIARSTIKAASIIASLPNGYAFASYATVPSGSNVIQNGPTVPIWMGCSMLSRTVSDGANSSSLNSYSKSGSVQTSISNMQTASSGTIQTLASMQNVDVLSGLITAQAIRAEVSSTATSSGATSAIVDATFTGLRVAGNSVVTSPRPNTTMHIANLGDVVLNEQGGPSNGSTNTYVGINMIDLHVTLANSFALPVGTQIIVAQVNSNEQVIAQPTTLYAHAYGLRTSGVTNSGSSSSGYVATAEAGCVDGSSQRSVTSSSTPNVGTTGLATATASGQTTPSGAKVNSQANVANMHLLNGLIQGSQVVAIANAMWSGRGSGSASTTLTNTRVAGSFLSKSPNPNTRLNILGLGYVILNEQNSIVNAAGASESVNAIHIYVTAKNIFNLPIGAQIIIGHADANTTSFS